MKPYKRCRPVCCTWKNCKYRKRNIKCPEATADSRPYSTPYFIILEERKKKKEK